MSDITPKPKVTGKLRQMTPEEVRAWQLKNKGKGTFKSASKPTQGRLLSGRYESSVEKGASGYRPVRRFVAQGTDGSNFSLETGSPNARTVAAARRGNAAAARQGSRRGAPSQPREGAVRRKTLTSNPPIVQTERYTNGKWVVVSRVRQGRG